jgi:acyl-CoA synthetase (AMP-forming)/AMP-acid ligase II
MIAMMALLIGDIFRNNARSVPSRRAATMGDRSLTYAELDDAGNRTAQVLRGLSVGRGARVACWSDTALDVLPLFAACSKLGAAFAPVDAKLGVEEATGIVGLARPQVLVSDEAHAEAAEVVARACGVSQLLRMGGGSGAGTDLDEAVAAARADDPHEPGVVETDPHVIFFTSGSTGRPKGVVLSHRANWLRAFHGVFRDAPERSVCMFPLFHMAGFTLALSAWQTRGEIAFVEAATAEALLGAVRARRANRLYCIPAIWARILETDFAPEDVASLRDVDTGTSATPPELIAALVERFPTAATRVYYGSTECGAGTALADADVLRKPGSVGLPVAGVALRLADDGEIQLRSPFMMDGYFDDPEATAAAFADGWYRTGDLGAFDDEGYLSVTGRLREVIRTGGETVAPTEVEAVLAEHPAIDEVAVVGLPDARWGEVVCAAVVTRPGATITLEDLKQHCGGRLARFKHPRRLEHVDALPRTSATQQIQRTLVVERILARAT